MPSIFIWKADTANTSKKYIRFYSGSNWVLEDNDYSSKSYMYLEQIVISESNNSVITFRTKDMPQDWIGTELLEVSNIQYELVKSDKYGRLERINDWFRFTTNNDTDFNEDFLTKEIINIKKWINNKTNNHDKQIKEYNIPLDKQYTYQSKTNTHFTPLNKQQVYLNFQEFLIKYTMPKI
jgi:hypothetical protein